MGDDFKIKIETISSQKQIRDMVSLYQEAWENSFGLMDLLKNETVCFLMSDEENGLVGYAFIEEDNKRGFVELQDIAISKKLQNKGLGKKMTRFLMEKYPYIKLIASVKKPNLIQFYQSLGFQIETIWENYYDIGVDGARMFWKR